MARDDQQLGLLVRGQRKLTRDTSHDVHPVPARNTTERFTRVGILFCLAVLVCGPISAKGSEKNLRVDQVTADHIRDLYQTGSILWITKGSQRSLYRWVIDSHAFNAVNIEAVEGKHVEAMHGDSSALYFAKEESEGRLVIYRVVPGNTVDIATHPDIVTQLDLNAALSIESLFWDGSRLWIGTGAGLYAWNQNSNSLEHLFEGPDSWDVKVKGLYATSDTLWIGTKAGLYKWKKDGSSSTPKKETIGHGVDEREIRSVCEVGSNLWMGTEDGLYRRNMTSGEVTRVLLPAKDFKALLSSDATLWIGTDEGLFRLNIDPKKWDAKIAVADNFPDSIDADDLISIKWKINNWDMRTTPELIEQTVVVYDSDEKRIDLTKPQDVEGTYNFIIPAMGKIGDYTVGIVATDLQGQKYESPRRKFSVATPPRSLVHYIPYVFGGGGALHIGLFVILMIASRYNKKAFEFLMDPIWRRVGIYYGFTILHSSTARLWILERYFREMKRIVQSDLRADHRYLSVMATRSDNSTVRTRRVFTRKELDRHPHSLVVGGPGTGKTEMINALMRSYFSRPTLRHAWKKFGFILIVVRVRDYPAMSLPKLACSELESKAMPFDDFKFFEKLFRQGGFLLVLDGLNEGNLEEEIKKYSKPRSVKLLMTSQTSMNASNISQLRLAPFERLFSLALLRQLIQDPAKKALAAGVPEDLEIRSGYDVRLIADLIANDEPLPRKRIDLFETIFKNSFRGDSNYPEAPLCNKAWNLWIAGERRFAPDNTLTDDRLAQLARGIVVPREGRTYEFCHDQMRDYLAAYWVVRILASIGATLTNLSLRQIWDVLSKNDQRAVFRFLAELIAEQNDVRKSETELRELADFAAAEIRQRVELLDAAKVVAQNHKWPMQVTVA